MDDSVGSIVHAFKYHGWQQLAEVMAGHMLPLLDDLPAGVLVPIPTDPRRRWRRGYNQAEVLAAALSRGSGRRVGRPWLERRRRADSQVGHTPAERLANLRGVFGALVARPEPAILVDDVFTTGSTLFSAALALRRSGVEEISGVTFARAELPLAALDRGMVGPSSFEGSAGS